MPESINKSVLIVEDDVMLAMDLAEQLEGFGFEILGPCKSCSEAMAILASMTCDIAVLDINLGTETSEAVAHELKSKGIAFVVVSGYSVPQYPAVFADAPALSKPLQTDQLVALLQ